MKLVVEFTPKPEDKRTLDEIQKQLQWVADSAIWGFDKILKPISEVPDECLLK